MSNQLSNKIIGKNLNGRYRVISALGTGGFGTTYLAEDQHRPGRPRCVIKQLQLNSDNTQLVEVTRRLFNTEAETLQKISHHEQIPELLASFEENIWSQRFRCSGCHSTKGADNAGVALCGVVVLGDGRNVVIGMSPLPSHA